MADVRYFMTSANLPFEPCFSARESRKVQTHQCSVLYRIVAVSTHTSATSSDFAWPNDSPYSEYLVNIGYTRRAAQKRVTGRRWRRIVLGHVLAEHVVRVEEIVRVSGRRSSGSFGSDCTAGYATPHHAPRTVRHSKDTARQ